eukprot:TRINITY_DN3842_c0_g1_i8.p1 TRINITY_DN3842_c0_g1~~TRINITY_DN3842_c0_g1_i8.p1  ORF type:complete len:201 (-),score=34.86 TRINITY_DN3842_c0_g1_i8:505-1107(-)
MFAPKKAGDGKYFEVEIDRIGEHTDVIVGYAIETGFDETKVLGEIENSVGLHRLNGQLNFNKRHLHSFGINPGIGETLGAAVSKDRSVWVTYNGSILNAIIEDNDKLAMERRINLMARFNDDEEKVNKEEKEFQKRRNASMKSKMRFDPSIQNVRPGITTTGPCVLLVNVGKMPFRAGIKELEHGLLQGPSFLESRFNCG